MQSDTPYEIFLVPPLYLLLAKMRPSDTLGLYSHVLTSCCKLLMCLHAIFSWSIHIVLYQDRHRDDLSLNAW